MNDGDFIPLLEQLKDLLLLGECFASDEETEAEILVTELDGITEQLSSGDGSGREALKQLFSPAGILHMTALDNGWSEIYDEMVVLLGVDGEDVPFI